MTSSDGRSSDGEIEKIEQLALIARRPDAGGAGKSIDVLSNSFPVRIACQKIFVYCITFEPDIPEDATEKRRSTFNTRSIRDKIDAKYGVWFYENTRLWSLTEVPGEQAFTDTAQTKTVSVRFLKGVSMNALKPDERTQYEQIAHIMLNKVVRMAELTRIGANYFEKNEELFGGNNKLDVQTPPGMSNIRLWRGYSMSMEQAVKGLQMHVDVVHRVLHQQNVAELIETTFTWEMKNARGSQDQALAWAKKKVLQELRDSCVLTIYNKRVYRVHDIDWDLGINDTFEKDGQQISYKNYFQQAYGETCKQKFKGMLIHFPKKKKSQQGPDRIILAPELCHMTGMTKKMKSNFTLMRTMADTTRLPAGVRHKFGSELIARLQDTINKQNGGETRGASTKRGRGGRTQTATAAKTEESIPLQLNPHAVELKGRILPQFQVQVKQRDSHISVDPYRGIRGAGDNTFIDKVVKKISRWAVVYEDERIANQFYNHVEQICKRGGMWGTLIDNDPYFEPVKRGQKAQDLRYEEAVRSVLDQDNQIELVVVILPDERGRNNPTAIYNRIKTVFCTDIPVLTQCITTKNLLNQKRVRSVMQNVVKQMLTKAGNSPWNVKFDLPDNSIELRQCPTMICGLDCNHDMKRNVSTISFCASYSADYTKYFTFVMHQAAGREVMIDGANLMIAALKKFKKKWNVLPQQIIIYRDGVSTSQLQSVVLEEVRSFKRAFATVTQQMKRTYDPKLSVIVTQKRVSARFLDKQHKSLPVGTVVDTGVVSAQFWDFYLIPCEAPFKGTASPTRFIVVYDDIKFTQDDIAALSNQLCLLYFNWMGPVRVPAPVQYAHKIAHMFGSAIDQRKPHDQLNGRPFFL